MKELALLEVTVVKLIVIGLIVFVSLWALKITIRNSPLRRSVKHRINRIIPLSEGIVWLVFMLWCIGQLIQNEFWSSIGVLVVIFLVVILLFWLVIRDYLAGIILKTDGSIKQNDWIRVKDIEGKITELGNRTLLVTAESGETISIPYSAIAGEISAKPNPGEKLINHSFELKLSKNSEVETVINQLRRSILNAPWSSINKRPEIKLFEEAPGYYHFEVNLYSTRMVYFQKIKGYLSESLSNAGYQILN